MAIKTFRTKRCFHCGQTSLIDLDEDRVQAWIGGSYVQDVFPEMSVGEREMLISGTHPECWEAIFSEE
jgi:hypothetical protein